MRLLILSDLHLECAAYEPPSAKLFDAVILAGDICQGPHAVQWAQKRPEFNSKPVVLVPGNHEYYGSERTQTLQVMRADAKGSNVHVLDRDELVLPGVGGAGESSSSVRILGATLWTDFHLEMENSDFALFRARTGMSDFSGSIRERAGKESRLFMPEDSLKQHRLSRAWLLEQLLRPPLQQVATVVVTHHGPSTRSIAARYANSDLNACFVSELPRPFFAQTALWVHGHVHNSFDYRIGRTRVVANPRGYWFRHEDAFENEAFRPDWVIDVPDGIEEGPGS